MSHGDSDRVSCATVLGVAVRFVSAFEAQKLLSDFGSPRLSYFDPNLDLEREHALTENWGKG